MRCGVAKVDAGPDLDVWVPEAASLLAEGEGDAVRSGLPEPALGALSLPGSPTTESDVALVDPHALTIPVTRTPATTVIKKRFIR